MQVAIWLPQCPNTGLCRRRSQRRHRHVECVDEPGRLIGQPHVAPELPAERLDQPRAEAALFGRADCRTVLLGPCEVQALRLLIQRPADVDAPFWDRQGAKLRGVGAKLVECHRDRDDGARCHPDIGSRNREFGLIGIIEGFGGTANNRAKVRAAPSCLQKEVVRASECE